MFFLGVKVARSTVKEVPHFTGGSSVIDPRWWRPLLECWSWREGVLLLLVLADE